MTKECAYQDKLNALCIYHVVDYDGVFSCLIVKHWIEQNRDKYRNFDCFGWTYGNNLPKVNYDDYDIVYLVDLMLPVDLMKQLSKKMIWIDHHLGNIEVSEKEGFSEKIQGLRRIGVGACELCWEFFFDKFNVPSIIQYISAYDVFDKTRFSWNKRTLPIQLGLKSLYGIRLDNFIPIFDYLLDSDNLDSIIEKGITIVEYEDNRHKIAAKNYAFPVEVCGGKYKGICCINTDFGSAIFDSISDDYDVCICTNIKTKPDGTVIYPVSMYSDASKTEFNLAKYMQGYRGNGHFHAAGGSLTREEFERLIFDRKI